MDTEQELEFEAIKEKFNSNYINAIIVGDYTKINEKELEKNHDFIKNYKVGKIVKYKMDMIDDNLDKYSGETIFKNQSILLLVSSMETYLKDMFKFLIINDDKMRKNFTKNKELKIGINDVVKIQGEIKTLKEVIAKKSFKVTKYHKVNDFIDTYKLIAINIHDILKNLKGSVITIFDNNIEIPIKRINLVFYNGMYPKTMLKHLIKIRNNIIHESKIYTDLDEDFKLIRYQSLVELFIGELHKEIRKKQNNF